MNRRKIAPRLRVLVGLDRPGPLDPRDLGPEDRVANERELRAVLGVVRTAQRVVVAERAEDVIPAAPWNRLIRSLSRLDKIAPPGSRGRRERA